MPNNKLQLVGIEPDGLVHVAAEGNIVLAGSSVVSGNLLDSILGANWGMSRVMIDFSRCAMIDSAAIGWLVHSSRQFKSGGGKLALYSLAPRVRQVMEFVKLDKQLNLADDEAAARSILNAGAAGKSDPAPREATQ